MRLFAIPLLAVTIPGQVFVDAVAGNDNNPGTGAQPVKSITRGAALAGANSAVFVLPGIYSRSATGEKFPIGIGTTAQQDGITIRGIGTAVIDFAKSSDKAFRIGRLAIGGRITALRFINSDNKWWTRAIDTAGSATSFEIDRCVFDGVNRGIVLWDATTPDVRGFKIHNNLFVDLHNDAINEFEKQGPNEVFNNTIVGKSVGANFVGILSDAQSSRFYNNLVVGMRDGFTRGINSTNANFTANCVFNTKNAWAGSFGGKAPAGNFAVDPQFADASKRDFRLKPTSPLLDRGLASVPHRMDLDGAPGAIDVDRNGTPQPDVGAWERPVAQLLLTHDRRTGAATMRIDGPRGLFGVILFAADDGLIKLGGGITVLLDPRSIFPVTTPALPLPATVRATIPTQPAGWRLVMQAAAWDVSGRRVYPAHQRWIQW